MITKEFTTQNGRELALVTFTIPGGTIPGGKWSDTINLVGDFNDWDPLSHPFHQLSDGSWSITLEMAIDQIYQFRYLCDGMVWFNDHSADGYIPNRRSGDNCLLITRRDFRCRAVEPIIDSRWRYRVIRQPA